MLSEKSTAIGNSRSTSVLEKYDSPVHKEKVAGSTDVLDVEETTFDKARTGQLLRKMDWNIVPFLSLLYLLSFLDRSNIGNARLAGLEADLDMKGLDYNIALAVFFPFYVAAEIPSNVMMKRTSPSLWLCLIMLGWGLCMALMGIVHNLTGLLVARAALGICEGGLFPGVTWYITLWYRRHECGLRMAIFFSAATLAGAFGGLLARAISEMHGIGGRPGWAWIFILEGIITILVAFFAKWIINDSPETHPFIDHTCTSIVRLNSPLPLPCCLFNEAYNRLKLRPTRRTQNIPSTVQFDALCSEAPSGMDCTLMATGAFSPVGHPVPFTPTIDQLEPKNRPTTRSSAKQFRYLSREWHTQFGSA